MVIRARVSTVTGSPDGSVCSLDSPLFGAVGELWESDVILHPSEHSWPP